MARNFARAVKEEGAARLRGEPELTPDQVDRRREICLPCTYRRLSDDRCALCGCPKERKIAWRSQSCPAGKW